MTRRRYCSDKFSRFFWFCFKVTKIFHSKDLWTLLHPKLSEPSIPVHQNKPSLLHFWCTAYIDCPDNVKLILNGPPVVKNIAFNCILADHDDSDMVNFNKAMLPTYNRLLSFS